MTRATTPSPCGWWRPAPTTTSTIGNGRVVRGNKQVNQWAEDWTFQRSGSATTPVGGGTLTAKCPNCGAPLDLDLAGTCKYCKAPVSSGAYDWVLARIAQLPGY